MNDLVKWARYTQTFGPSDFLKLAQMADQIETLEQTLRDIACIEKGVLWQSFLARESTARKDALEEAAKVADQSEAFDRKMFLEAEDDAERDIFRRGILKSKNIAAFIRALKDKK